MCEMNMRDVHFYLWLGCFDMDRVAVLMFCVSDLYIVTLFLQYTYGSCAICV